MVGHRRRCRSQRHWDATSGLRHPGDSELQPADGADPGATDDTPTRPQSSNGPAMTNAQMLSLIGIEPEQFVQMVADGVVVEMEAGAETADDQ